MSQLLLSWFELNQERSDLDNVLNFLEQVPINLEELFGQPSFRTLLDKDEKSYRINSELFFAALNEAKHILLDALNDFRGQMSMEGESNNNKFITQANSILQQIGFTGNSLELKAKVLNKLWSGVIKAGQGVIDFASRPVVKAIRKLLAYLNSLLGSLVKLIPGADAIKEIKETGESYLEMEEEL